MNFFYLIAIIIFRLRRRFITRGVGFDISLEAGGKSIVRVRGEGTLFKVEEGEEGVEEEEEEGEGEGEREEERFFRRGTLLI